MKLIHDEKTVQQAVDRLVAATEGSELTFAFMGPRHWVDEQADALKAALSRALPSLSCRREAEYGASSSGFYPTGAYSTVQIIVRKG